MRKVLPLLLLLTCIFTLPSCANEKIETKTISFSQDVVDFGFISSDKEKFRSVTITSTGNTPIIIEEIKQESDNENIGFMGPQTPKILEPNETARLIIYYNPIHAGVDTDTLIVTTDSKELKDYKLVIKGSSYDVKMDFASLN